MAVGINQGGADKVLVLFQVCPSVASAGRLTGSWLGLRTARSSK